MGADEKTALEFNFRALYNAFVADPRVEALGLAFNPAGIQYRVHFQGALTADRADS